MAFRIDESVVRGEVDNRVKGRVRGKVWLAGRAEPLELELKGNACPDLAGCLLKFRNRKAPVADRQVEALMTEQIGSIGDLTASRKVRVFDVPVDEAYDMCKRGEKPPEHMANCLYLEWFSQRNGRVVIESVDYELEISEPAWRMTDEENIERARNASDGMSEFIGRLDEAINTQKKGQKDPEEPWDEYDYERFLKEADARTDKYGELLEKYGDDPNADELIAKEMGWDKSREVGHEIEIDESALEEEIELDPAREGIDWIKDETGEISHPLHDRCARSGARFMNEIQRLGLDKEMDADTSDFLFEFLTTGAKLAGALNPLARNGAVFDAGFTIAYLKRALSHLQKSQRGLENLAPRRLLPQPLIDEARKELFEIREGILNLMRDLRGHS